MANYLLIKYIANNSDVELYLKQYQFAFRVNSHIHLNFVCEREFAIERFINIG